ncbi:hypothetical protein EDE05_102184 [Neorhizobium sp. R1-B]|nr:hypothetical protein EDE05_102184 [Neorhizobium sp. R1-B]
MNQNARLIEPSNFMGSVHITGLFSILTPRGAQSFFAWGMTRSESSMSCFGVAGDGAFINRS